MGFPTRKPLGHHGEVSWEVRRSTPSLPACARSSERFAGQSRSPLQLLFISSRSVEGCPGRLAASLRQFGDRRSKPQPPTTALLFLLSLVGGSQVKAAAPDNGLAQGWSQAIIRNRLWGAPNWLNAHVKLMPNVLKRFHVMSTCPRVWQAD